MDETTSLKKTRNILLATSPPIRLDEQRCMIRFVVFGRKRTMNGQLQDYYEKIGHLTGIGQQPLQGYLGKLGDRKGVPSSAQPISRIL
ncbi:hypothetical protein V6Z12_D13G194600 [Gossypium hirsutum]